MPDYDVQIRQQGTTANLLTSVRFVTIAMKNSKQAAKLAGGEMITIGLFTLLLLFAWKKNRESLYLS